jgi:hypothetical protein
LAARTNRADIISLLLYFKLDVETPGENGWTALHEAVSMRAYPCVRFLLFKGAKVDAKNDRGETVKALALGRCGYDTIEMSRYFGMHFFSIGFAVFSLVLIFFLPFLFLFFFFFPFFFFSVWRDAFVVGSLPGQPLRREF